MSCEVQLIPLDDIRPLCKAQISEAYKKLMKKMNFKLRDFDFLLVVERNENDDVYILVGGYDRYYYMKDCTDRKVAPCIVESSSKSDEKMFKILRRLFPPGDNQKNNKERILEILKALGFSTTYIADQTPFSESDLKKEYQYSPSVPKKFINDNTTKKILNEIVLLDLSSEAKTFLFERAGLQKGDPNRLTGQVITIIKSFIKKDKRIINLTPAQQIEALTQAFNPKQSILDKIRDSVNRFIFRKAS